MSAGEVGVGGGEEEEGKEEHRHIVWYLLGLQKISVQQGKSFLIGFTERELQDVWTTTEPGPGGR